MRSISLESQAKDLAEEINKILHRGSMDETTPIVNTSGEAVIAPKFELDKNSREKL